MKTKKVLIIVPCFNEAQCIKLLYEKLSEVLSISDTIKFSLLFVDDGSSDDTLTEVKKLEREFSNSMIKYISFARNFGKEAALYAGLDYALQDKEADYMAVMDADLQHPPELLLEMFDILEKGEYDCVGARRVNRKGEGRLKSFLSAGFYHVIHRITGMKLVHGMTDYRMMKRSVVEAIVSMKERERFIKGIYSWIGFKTLWIDYENVERVAGESKWSIRALFHYAKNGFIAFATTPLRCVIYLGMLTVFVALIYSVCLLHMTISGFRVWSDSTTILLLLLFFSGIIITILGVIGEYLARIYMEVKGRPIYILRETNVL